MKMPIEVDSIRKHELHPNNVNRDSGIEIAEALVPTIVKHNSRSTTNRTYVGITSISITQLVD